MRETQTDLRKFDNLIIIRHFNSTKSILSSTLQSTLVKKSRGNASKFVNYFQICNGFYMNDQASNEVIKRVEEKRYNVRHC